MCHALTRWSVHWCMHLANALRCTIMIMHLIVSQLYLDKSLWSFNKFYGEKVSLLNILSSAFISKIVNNLNFLCLAFILLHFCGSTFTLLMKKKSKLFVMTCKQIPLTNINLQEVSEIIKVWTREHFGLM